MATEDVSIDRAAALIFDPAIDRAPRVLARGRGALARRIVETAHSAGRPVVRDAALSEVLAALPVGVEIPERLYLLVSGVFALIYKLEVSHRSRAGNEKN